MKSFVFAKRVGKEIFREPLSYVFCLGFPLIMLLIMSIVDSSIPVESQMSLFHLENLAPAMAYFGLTFVMLFTAIQVSKDRSSALLLRLYASPMKAFDYALGYTLPVLLLGLSQVIICFTGAAVMGLLTGCSLAFGSVLLSVLLLLPSLFMFIGLGIMFGSAVNEKAAPGICSIVISLSGMIGGIWMDVDSLGGVIKKVGQVFPFYHGVKLARFPFFEATTFEYVELILTIGFGLVFYILSMIIFTSKMKKDLS